MQLASELIQLAAAENKQGRCPNLPDVQSKLTLSYTYTSKRQRNFTCVIFLRRSASAKFFQNIIIVVLLFTVVKWTYFRFMVNTARIKVREYLG